MKAALGFVLAVAIVACVAHASDVVPLTNDNFDEVISTNDFVLVEFFAPWCGHCKRLAPEYEAAATALKGSAVLATVDCTVEEALASRFGIQGFPTLKFFKRGGEPIDYQGDRNAKGIEAWVQSKMEPAVIPLSSKEAFDGFKNRPTLARVVLFAGEKADELAKVFAEVAESGLSNDYSFSRVSSSELASELGQEMDTIVFYYAHQNPVVYKGEKTAAALKEYIESGKALPKLETLVLNQSFINRVTKAQKAMWMAFHETAEQLEKVREIASALEGEAHLLESPVAAYPELASQWGASGQKYPTFIVTVWEEGHPTFKAFDEELEFNVENARKFLSECKAGTCTPYKKSQPLPEEDAKEAVKTLVHKNFDKVVLDDTKDVVVEFYAPWCGHCKALAPLYEELATSFQKVPSVVIAKIDATQNYIDPKYNIRGFPTLLMFPANNKDGFVRYESNRDFPSLAKWVIENAHHSIDSSVVLGDREDSKQGGEKDEL